MPDTPTPQEQAEGLKLMIGKEVNYPHTPRSRAWVAQVFAAIDRMREALEKALADMAAAQAGAGEPVAWRDPTNADPGQGCTYDKATHARWPHIFKQPLYASPVAAQAAEVPSVESAHQMGATGGPVVESERLAFEAWMRGHCWALSATWTGTQYRSDTEASGDVDPRAMATRRLWAAWRDRAALAAPPSPVARVPLTDEQIDEAARGTGVLPRSFEAGVRFAEAAHGIGPQDGGGEGC